MKRMIVASRMDSSIPQGLGEFYDRVSLEDIVDSGYLPSMEDATEFMQDQDEMAKAYGAHVIGYLLAKEEYEDVLSDNGEEFLTVVEEDETGREIAGAFVGDRLIPTSRDHIGDLLERYGLFDE